MTCEALLNNSERDLLASLRRARAERRKPLEDQRTPQPSGRGKLGAIAIPSAFVLTLLAPLAFVSLSFALLLCAVALITLKLSNRKSR